MSVESERQLASTAPVASLRHPLPPEVTESDVRQQLERIRASQPFRSSRRCVVFLDFVVQAALSGRLESLKERTIGIEVFGRDPNYDTNQDPVVRGTASEVRKRLAQYYQIAGHERELRVELPAGSYLPDFHTVVHTAEVVEAQVRPPNYPQKLTPLLIAAVIAAVLASVVTFLVSTRASRHPQTAVDQLWAPILQSSGPVLLCVGQPKVYNLLGSLEAEMAKRMPGLGHVLSPAESNEKLTVRVGQFAPNWDRYLALGDAVCLSDIAALLAQRSHIYHIRGGGSTSFADLRENPSVLIGAFTNDWTLRLTGQLRFTFDLDPDQNTHYVHDRLNPSNRAWQLTGIWPEWRMPVDYAIVSRVRDGTTGKMVVTAAGITQYGTAAAGEFLSNPEYLSELVRKAPPDWQHKNIQVVLATKVIDGTAGPPRVLAAHFW